MNFKESLNKLRNMSDDEVVTMVEKATGKELVSYEGIDALVAALMGFYNGELKKKSSTGHKHTKEEITDFTHNHDDRYYTGSAIDEKFKNFCPFKVGDIYLTTTSTNPSSIYLGTTWEKIENKFLLGTSSSGASKQLGGSNTKTISQANLPNIKLNINSFSLSRGTMNITGDFNQGGQMRQATGAFYIKSKGAWSNQGLNSDGGIVGLDASRSWTGTTSTAQPQTVNLGNGLALDITPSYYTCHMWLRLT